MTDFHLACREKRDAEKNIVVFVVVGNSAISSDELLVSPLQRVENDLPSRYKISLSRAQKYQIVFCILERYVNSRGV